MKFSKKDFTETAELSVLLSKIDHIDGEYVSKVSDEIFKKQPFFLSALLGYRFDVSTTELEELMKIYFLIWEYFKPNQNVRNKKVTEALFTKMMKRNIQMLKYSEDEPSEQDKLEVYSADLQNLKSKSLLAAVFFRFYNRPVLIKMEKEKTGTILIGIKSFIECFETI